MNHSSIFKKGLLLSSFAFLFFAFQANHASAATCTFASTEATNDFNLDANWSCGTAPTVADLVVVPAGTSTTMTTASSTIGALNATGTINTATFNLTVAGTATIPSGGVVTSTSGTLTFTGAVSSTGSIGSSVGDMLFGSTFQNNGTFDVGSGTATSTNGLTNASTGTINNNGGTLSLIGAFTNSGTYNAQSGTFRIAGSGSPSVTNSIFNNFVSIKSGGTSTLLGGSSSATVLGTLVMNGGAIQTGGTLNVVGTTTILSGASVTGTTTGLLSFAGAVSSTGSIGSSSGDMLFGSTFQNNGTFDVGSGTATTTGSLTNAGTINNNGGVLSLLADFTNSGTFNRQSGTVRVAGTAAQALGGALYNNFVSIKSSGTVTAAASSTILGTLTMNGGTLSAAATAITVGGASTFFAGSTVTSTSGTLTFTGAVTSTGSIGSSSGNMLFGSSFLNNGVFSPGSGYATTTGYFYNNGTVYAGSGTTTFQDDFANNVGGVYYPQSSVARFSGVSLISRYIDMTGTGSFNTLILNATGVFVLSTNVSSTSFIFSSGTLDIGTYRFAATSSFSNTGGYINVNSGTLVGALTTSDFTNASGTVVTSLTNPGSMYVTITDPSRNLSATTTESFTVTVTGNGASGGDSETLTLVETSAASGVFRNAGAMNVKYAGVATAGGGEFEINGTGSGSYTYTDAYDASDTTSTSVTLNFAGANATNAVVNSPTGGGGLGSSQALIPVVTTYQTLVTNLANLGIPVHALVKLPDDGNLSTQEDSAVYYIGTDGKRHAFPNSKVYFTWYADFSQVQVVNLTQLSSVPLGSNITYKPGVRMVKFTTDPKVYVVDKGGVLRWITSEDLATALYGSAWNTMIDDVSDAFYVNYTFGAHIISTADFSVSGVSTVVYPD